jgi:hypothetical protein
MNDVAISQNKTEPSGNSRVISIVSSPADFFCLLDFEIGEPRLALLTWRFVVNRGYSFGVAGVFAVLLGSCSSACADEKQPESPITHQVRAVLNAHCVACHGEKKQKGDIRLDSLGSLDAGVLRDLLGRMQEQIHFREMPPDGAKELARADREVLMKWSSQELRRLGGTDLIDKLRLPNYGNAIDHAKLFSGEIKDPPFTPARRWLISPQIFQERTLDSLHVVLKNKQQSLFGINSPFTLPERSGVRDYDLTPLDGTHFVALRTNAAWMADKVVGSLKIKLGEPIDKVFVNPKDRWIPPVAKGPKKEPLMTAFEQVMKKKESPTEEELKAAIQLQFERVLARPASDAELSRYTVLMRSVEKVADSTESLRRMLEAVWLESEFVYRLEFGTGEPDEFGRKILSPREASYALAYALGDKAPDATLVKAANEGRLTTKADYEREVKRMLADKSSFYGPVDPTLAREHKESYISTPHPKMVRFFRDFFGYPLAIRIFKDIERSDGIYRVPDRGTSGTPGFLIVEADRVVARAVEADRNVFETLLTTDEYFVYHNLDNETGAKLIAGWRIVYDTLKDTNWRKDPDGVAKEHAALLKQYVPELAPLGKGRGVHDTNIVRMMRLFEDTFGRGGRPFTTFPWAHGNRFWHSSLYNMPHTPSDGNYGGERVFDYEPVQPFKVPNRKGILTHPAWLIAHAQNSATDPIRRGKWIREKLLAGMVPDVPITVDAQIPEHKDKTLRERLDVATNKQECWKCHQHMNPLGLPFEMYDDFGRFRTAESLEHPDNIVANPKIVVTKDRKGNGATKYKTLPVVSTGRLDGTGDPKLDGEVQDAFDLIDRLAQSERVRQSIIRHAFRYYLGRNELLSDSRTLIDADRAYVSSGGSFKAVVVSLLTSDSFRYRK